MNMYQWKSIELNKESAAYEITIRYVYRYAISTSGASVSKFVRSPFSSCFERFDRSLCQSIISSRYLVHRASLWKTVEWILYILRFNKR